MCSNYHLPSAPQAVTRLAQRFGGHWHTHWTWPDEVLPTLVAPVLRSGSGSGPVEGASEAPEPEVFLAQFGLLPHWARDPTLARKTYNARAETVHEKPNFRDAWRKAQRCIIPAQWVYEPCWESGKAVRWKVQHTDGRDLAVAGLWSRWWAANGAEVMSFTMLTVHAQGHPLMQRFHRPDEDDARMVVLLDDADFGTWLHGTPEQASALMRAHPAEGLTAEPAPRSHGMPGA